MKRTIILCGFIFFVFIQSFCFNQRLTLAEDWSGWKNFYGISGVDSPANHAKYAKQMGYDSIAIKDQYTTNYVSTYRNNSDLSGLKFYLLNPHRYYQVLSNHSGTINTTSTYSQTNQDFYNQNMVWKSNDPFPNNLATGGFGSSTSFAVLWDFQQQAVIDSVVENIITYAKSLEDSTTGFTFGGYIIESPTLCGNFFNWDSTQNKCVRTNLTYWTGTDSGLVHGAITHEYSTYSDGVAAFYKKLNTRRREQFGSDAKWILSPWNIYSAANNGSADEWVYQVKSRTDYAEMTPDMVTARAADSAFVDDTRNFNSGPTITKDMAGITQQNKVGEYENRFYAAKAGINGAWYHWLRRFGDTGDMLNFKQITEVYPRLKLVRCIPNWDNLNTVPLADRSWDGSVYQSTKSYISSDVLYSRHPKTGKLFAVFLTTNGIIKLNAGETVTSVQYADGYFMEGGDGSNDVTISANEISLKSSVSIDKDANGNSIGKGYVFTISTGAAPSVITMSATDITSNSATLNGTANANGPSTTVWFEFSTTSGSYTNQSSTQNISGYGDSLLSASISGLSPATTYYYRIAAQNAMGTVYGSEMSFTTLDITAPNGSISINSSNSYTNTNGITLTLSATDDVGVTGYYLSASAAAPSLSDAGWISITSTSSYSASVSYSLGSGDGTKVVYVWYKDSAGNVSASASDSITLDTAAPTVTITSPTTGATYTTTDSTTTVSGTGADATSGLDTVTYSLNSGSSLTATSTTNWLTHSLTLKSGANTITVTAQDKAGNSATATITVTYKPISGTQTINIDPSLKASYGFDEGSGTALTDSSGNSYNGTIGGGAMWADGKTNKALSFDGIDDRVSFATNLNITGELSVSAWVHPKSAPNGLGRVVASTYRYNSTASLIRGWTLGSNYGSTDSFYFLIYDDSGNSAQAFVSNFFANNLNQWVYVTGVFKPAQYLRLYVNGQFAAEDTTSIPSAIAYDSATNLRLGMCADTTIKGMWNGLIDEFKVYSRALTSAEVQELYASVLLTANTNSAENITSSSVDLSATVNAKDENATAYFQYGEVSGNLNSQTASQTVNGSNTDTHITASISGLNSNLTYYYRIVAINSMGTVYGAEQSFTTQAASDTTPPSISITIPSTGTAYISKSNKITVSGTASDAGSGLSAITWSSNQSSGTANGTTNWSINDIQLNQGSNTVSVTAQDRQGNTNVKTITITYVPEAMPANSTWKPVPLRTQAQKDAGLSGGEGMQMIHSISYAPSNPNVVYFAVDTSQVWKSVDDGNTWHSKRNGFRSNGGDSLMVDPKDENTVFVSGTASRVGVGDETSTSASIVDGIYRTTDGGDTWQLVYQTDYYRGKEGQHFAFDPDSFNGTRHLTIYAGTHSKGILKSTDGGITWAQLPTNTNLDNMRILDMEIHKSGSQAILYVATNNNNNNGISSSANGLYKVTDNNGTITAIPITNLPDYPRTIAVAIQPNPSNDIIYAAAGTSKVYKSIDGGNTFVSKSNGLTTNGEYKNISISPVDSNYLYVKTQLSSPNTFYSHDGGETWQKPGNFDEGNLLINPGDGYFGTQVAPHPTDKNIAIMHLQSDRLVKTTNGGQTWRYSGNGYMGARRSADKMSVYFDPNNSARTIFFLVDHGPILTEDGGNTWRNLKIPGIDGKTTLMGAVDPNNPNIIITAAGSWMLPRYTLIRTTNGGNNESDWSVVYPAFDQNFKFISFHPQNSNYVYAGFASTGLISKDNGQTWTSTGNKSIRAVYPKNGDIIYAIELPASGNSKLWRSEDKGVTWVDLMVAPFREAQSIDIDPQDPNTLYAAVSNGIYKFSSGVWAEIGKSHGIPDDVYSGSSIFSAQSVVVDPNNSSRIYVGFSGYSVTAARHLKSYIFCSEDSGQTWQDIGYNLGEYSKMISLAIDPRNGDFHASTAHGNYVLVNSSSDTAAPSGSIRINANAIYTNSTSVSLGLLATDHKGVTGYYLSTSATAPQASASGWTAVTSTTSYSANVSYSLAVGDGSKTVYVWYKDAAGNISTSASDAITLDTTAPSGSIRINANAIYTNSTSVSLGLSATDNKGVTGYYLSTSATAPQASASGWTAVTATTSYSANVSYSLAVGDGSKTVYVWYKDAAGNISTSASDAITLDTTAPTVTITSPTSNSTYSTTTSSISLGGSASDSASGVASVTWSNDKGGSGNATGTNFWSAASVSLQSGTNTITVPPLTKPVTAQLIPLVY